MHRTAQPKLIPARFWDKEQNRAGAGMQGHALGVGVGCGGTAMLTLAFVGLAGGLGGPPVVGAAL